MQLHCLSAAMLPCLEAASPAGHHSEMQPHCPSVAMPRRLVLVVAPSPEALLSGMLRLCRSVVTPRLLVLAAPSSAGHHSEMQPHCPSVAMPRRLVLVVAPSPEALPSGWTLVLWPLQPILCRVDPLSEHSRVPAAAAAPRTR
jgi:hypothetical protein